MLTHPSQGAFACTARLRLGLLAANGTRPLSLAYSCASWMRLCGPVRGAESVDAPGVEVLVQGLDDRPYGNGRVVAMQQVQVYVIRPKPGQRVEEVGRYVERGDAGTVPVVVRALADDHDVISRAAGFHPPAKRALAVPVAVLVGRVEGRAAELPHLVEQIEAPFGLLGADHDGTLYEPGYGFVDTGHAPVLHARDHPLARPDTRGPTGAEARPSYALCRASPQAASCRSRGRRT